MTEPRSPLDTSPAWGSFHVGTVREPTLDEVADARAYLRRRRALDCAAALGLDEAEAHQMMQRVFLRTVSDKHQREAEEGELRALAEERDR